MTTHAKPSPSLPFSSAGLQALRDIAASGAGVGAGITVVCGFPAAGKTTATRLLAEMLNPVVLDKDTFAPQLEESVMSELNGNPHDRDSDLYRRVVAPHLYAALVQQAVTIAKRCPVVVDAPFLGYVETAAQRGLPLADYIRAITQAPDARIRTVWVDTDTDRIRDRMRRRGAERDLPKLSDWNTYRTTVLDSGLARTGPSVVDHVITN
ncbi:MULTISPECIES: AAA family ATPase [Nocardia]|uniref:AAA family ATPase n=1 Tax=Nocardia TaxID=1817 RepID=UPI0024550D2B|nr:MULTISPECIES: AAA family ATPase [Nocardia]